MKSSRRDKTEGKFHQMKGKAKQVAGKISDNPKLEAEGAVERIAGKIQEKRVKSRRFLGSSADGHDIFEIEEFKKNNINNNKRRTYQ